MVKFSTLASALLSALAVAAPSTWAVPATRTGLTRRAPAPPSQDPFYQPPAGYQSAAPGTILRSRQVDVAALGVVPLPNVQAWQLLYRTNGAQDNSPTVTVTTVFKPANASTDKLVGFATAEDSAASQCAPSYNYQLGAPQDDVIVSAELFTLTGVLQQGWIVSSPDHEGPNNSFTAGRLEGKMVLDGLRAALNFPELGLSSGTKVAGMGYSGGAIATGWAAALQPTYAPELNVVGFAHGGTPANISGTFNYIDGGLFAGFGFSGVAGLTGAYPELENLVNSIATADGKAALADAAKQCAMEDITEFAFKKLQSDTYTSAGAGLLYLPTVQDVVGMNVLGRFKNETPTAPLLVYHSTHDEIVPLADADTMVASYCANGAKLTYVRDIGLSEHASLELLFFPTVLNWLHDRLNGVPANPGCQTENTVVPTFSAQTLGTALNVVLQNLLGLLGNRIGVDDGLFKGNLTKGTLP